MTLPYDQDWRIDPVLHVRANHREMQVITGGSPTTTTRVAHLWMDDVRELQRKRPYGCTRLLDDIVRTAEEAEATYTYPVREIYVYGP